MVYQTNEEDFGKALKSVQSKWAEMSDEEKSHAIDFISDFHKDVYGYRPRREWLVWGLV